MLPKERRLKDKDDFQDVYLRGKFFSSGPVTLKIAGNGREISRFGFVVGKNYSKRAVDRNNAKRMLRAAVAPFLEKAVPGFDLVISIRKPLPGQQVNLQAVSGALHTIFERNNLLKK